MRLDAFAYEQLRARLGKLEETIKHAHHDADEHAVHQLRVAIRRFLQVLAVFREILPGKRADAAEEKLDKIKRAAGNTRDFDIALELIGPRAPEALHKALKAKRWKAAAVLQHRLDSAAHGNWVAKWRERLVLKDSDDPVMPFAEALLKPIEKALLKQGDKAAAPDTQPLALHRFRIASKRLRFSLEVFEPLSEADFAPRIEAVKHLQDILGDAQDCVVAAELVTDLKGPPAIERRLIARQRRLTAQFRREWPKMRSAIAKAR